MEIKDEDVYGIREAQQNNHDVLCVIRYNDKLR